MNKPPYNEPDAETDHQLKELFSVDLDDHVKETDHIHHALSRTRFNVAQKDAVSFSFVKIWITIAEMLAPLFAHFTAKRHSSGRHKRKPD